MSVPRNLMIILGLAAAVSTLPDKAVAQTEAGIGLMALRYSLDPASPELNPPAPADQSGAHVFAGVCNGILDCDPPLPWVTPPMLGLVIPDNIDSFSPGAAVATTFPPPTGNRLAIHFSITPASVGANPVIMAEVAGNGAASDIFQIRYPNPALNQFADGVAPPWPFLGLQPASDVDGWAWVAPPGAAQAYFTLDAATAAAYAVTPADIFWVNMGGLFATRAALGLVAGDDIDALSVHQTGNPPVWEAGELIYFSLRPGSPSLAANGWSPADILAVFSGGVPFVWAPAGALGLLPTDDINALQIFDPPSVPSLSGIGVVLCALLLLAGAVVVMFRRF